MDIYHKNILRGYLDKEPECYKIPPFKTSESVQRVKSLLPIITKVELHLHKHPDGKELAVIITGDNLWFCYYVEIYLVSETLKIYISPKDITGKQINYNHIYSINDTFAHATIDAEYVHVMVYSSFTNAISTVVPLVYTVSYSIDN